MVHSFVVGLSIIQQQSTKEESLRSYGENSAHRTVIVALAVLFLPVKSIEMLELVLI
jgi:hypothetical protein